MEDELKSQLSGARSPPCRFTVQRIPVSVVWRAEITLDECNRPHHETSRTGRSSPSGREPIPFLPSLPFPFIVTQPPHPMDERPTKVYNNRPVIVLLFVSEDWSTQWHLYRNKKIRTQWVEINPIYWTQYYMKFLRNSVCYTELYIRCRIPVTVLVFTSSMHQPTSITSLDGGNVIIQRTSTGREIVSGNVLLRGSKWPEDRDETLYERRFRHLTLQPTRTSHG